MSVAEPQKELRFTRAAQALPFWLAGAALIAAALILVVASFYRADNPALPHPAWAALPLVLAWASLRVAHRCTRHAYLILTPLGIEIFPFLRPERNLQLVYWGQVADAEFTDRRMTLHFNEEQSAGVHLSLVPIPRARRDLLRRAIEGRLEKNRQSASDHRQ